MPDPGPGFASAAASPENADHELLRVFDAGGFRLCDTLYAMLNEHYSHRTERRGAGYTQATRHLSTFVNQLRRPYEYEEALLFANPSPAAAHGLVASAAALGVDLPFRNLDLRDPPEALRRAPDVLAEYGAQADRQAILRSLPNRLDLEESRLLAAIVVDLVLSRSPSDDVPDLRPWPEKLAIGTCPLAEKYFLELAQGFVRRKGRMNVIVSEAGAPLLVEKVGLGDDHSCLSVVPLLLNGVRLPRGSLFGVAYSGDVAIRANRQLAGQVIPVARCDGFRFLRLTTLAVSPANRKRAFSAHYEAQVAGGLFEPGAATIEQIERLTREQLGSGAVTFGVPARALRSLKVVYSEDMVSEPGEPRSVSASKPRWVARALAERAWPVELVPPQPVSLETLYRAHDPTFVDGILALRLLNGFGSRSESVARSLPFTCGALLTSARLALEDGVSASLTSGFHHAGYSSARGYCTFNGLIVAAMALLDGGHAGRVAIVDCDFHYGDGTQSLIRLLNLHDRVLHVSFGKAFRRRDQADTYLAAVRDLPLDFGGFQPDIVFFQAGADPHVDDPLGGLLSTDQMRERDRTVFTVCRELGIPLTWNLAGGYQEEPDGSIPKVVALHLNTFDEALRVWNLA